MGYLRFWDMLPPTNGSFEVRKVGASESEQSLLSGSAYAYSSYVEFAVGRYQLAVFKKGDRKAALKVLNIDLKPETFFTILVSPKGGVITVEAFDDTNDPKTTTGTLTIRNYFSGLTVDVSAGAQKIVDALPYGESRIATDLPLGKLPLTLHSRLPNGTPAESSAEADFNASNRATLLIIPDSYGRFRPRVTIDGKNR
jgi:hypothetical protein